MKTIGLLGGMSWESTALYYRLINQRTRALRGGLHSAPIAMISVDFHIIEALQQRGDWHSAGQLLAAEGRRLESAGAQLLLLCTNTMHKVADDIQQAVDIPLLHLADATATEIKRHGHRSSGLLGTRFTMEQDFYKGRLEQHGLTVQVPDSAGRDTVHRIIYDELCVGKIEAQSRQAYRAIVSQLQDSGSECVIAGCTEIGLLIQPQHVDIPLFDTTEIHAFAAVEQALA